MLTLPKGTLPPPHSLSPCSCHSNAPFFGVIRSFYHACTPSPKYAFPPLPIILLLLRHALRSIQGPRSS
ncbi:hypothetical protein AZE42_13573 [Rhizopogon vesiculosus]|uniref:Uncharacterized protein n=1 Tax=Rhizopogon vesiculosus TaxID=180088 RepID=A0A1J8QHX7_9AGAM|nr:hypothetical protein AZE42_13573 [Rhizopogon vesiculosus]